MKAYIHARLDEDDRSILDELKARTGRTDTELVRRGLRLAVQEVRAQRSALDLAGRSAGRFRNGPPDLSTNRRHLEGFGE
jgi:hypothetical protein